MSMKEVGVARMAAVIRFGPAGAGAGWLPPRAVPGDCGGEQATRIKLATSDTRPTLLHRFTISPPRIHDLRARGVGERSDHPCGVLASSYAFPEARATLRTNSGTGTGSTSHVPLVRVPGDVHGVPILADVHHSVRDRSGRREEIEAEAR